jgi:ABC-type antimicrobial peptide transport system permease subunit
LNLIASCRDQPRGFADIDRREHPMKIALLVLLGLVLGALGGAALGIGAGLAWVEIFKTTGFEGYSGMLVFFTFMPLGAAIGGLGGALLFGVIAARDAEIAIEQEPARPQDT